MPDWFLAFEVLAGALFVIQGGVSLARGRSLVPRLLGKKPPSPWEFVTQMLLGVVFLLAAASMWPDSPVRMLAAFGAVLVALLGVGTAVIAVIHSARSPQPNRPMAG